MLRNQHGGEHERRLDRHADALADDRMRLARGIADAKDAVALPQPHARTDRSGREPRAGALGPLQGFGDAGALAPQDGLEHVAGPLARARFAIAAEPVLADATGERGDAVVGDDHAAVAAGERQHRQQVGCDRRLPEVGLESEQVAGPTFLAALRSLPGQRLPRAVRGNDQRGLKLVLGTALPAQAEAKGVCAALDRLQRARLEQRDAAELRLAYEQAVEPL